MPHAIARSRNPALEPDAERQARIDLAAAFRLAARLGLHEGAANHFSLMVPGSSDRFLVNPHGLHFGEIKASDLLLVDQKGNVLAGRYPLEPSSFYIHARIHLSRADAVCVLHTHMPFATALTMVEGGELLPCHQNALRFYGQIAYDDGYNGFALADEEGDRMARALSDRRVLMLANHGVVVTGASVALAFDDLYYLERAAQAQLLAMSTGKPLRLIADNMARATQAQFDKDHALYGRVHFESLRRILEREEPEFAD